jgi:hypothetical protein
MTTGTGFTTREWSAGVGFEPPLAPWVGTMLPFTLPALNFYFLQNFLRYKKQEGGF